MLLQTEIWRPKQETNVNNNKPATTTTGTNQQRQLPWHPHIVFTQRSNILLILISSLALEIFIKIRLHWFDHIIFYYITSMIMFHHKSWQYVPFLIVCWWGEHRPLIVPCWSSMLCHTINGGYCSFFPVLFLWLLPCIFLSPTSGAMGDVTCKATTAVAEELTVVGN